MNRTLNSLLLVATALGFGFAFFKAVTGNPLDPHPLVSASYIVLAIFLGVAIICLMLKRPKEDPLGRLGRIIYHNMC